MWKVLFLLPARPPGAFVKSNQAPTLRSRWRLLSATCLSLTLSACALSEDQKASLNSNPVAHVPAEAIDFGTVPSVPTNMSFHVDDMMFATATTNDTVNAAATAAVETAAIDSEKLQNTSNPPIASKPTTIKTTPTLKAAVDQAATPRNVAVSAPLCASPFTGQDGTIRLKTRTHLKLRSGPSTEADTLRIFAPETLLTARKLTCGNWTEVVVGRHSIGFVYSLYLTSPEE